MKFLMKREDFVAFNKRQTGPRYRSEPNWDNSRNVSTFNKKLYPVTASSLKYLGEVYQTGVPVDDGAGNYNYTSIKRSDAWMSIATLKVEQIFEYRGKNVKTTHIIKVRYEVIVEKTDHIILNDLTYEVVNVDPDTDKKLYKAILCTVFK